MRATSLFIVICLALTSSWLRPAMLLRVVLSQAESNQEIHVLDSVPEPNDEEIRKIRTAEQWPNPHVVVDADEYQLILHDQSRTALRMGLDELEKALLKTPLERWPLGRVVAVSENGLRSPGDNEKIAKNLEELKRMLRSHKLRVELWPSA